MEYFKDCMTQEQLKTRYKEWVLKLHPDRHPDDPEAEQKFKEMQEQYEEREAELRGDYSKSRKSRERRERENRERYEREQKEKEQRRVEMVIEEARRNRSIAFGDLKKGAYIYARSVKTGSAYEWEDLTVIDDILRMVVNEGVNDECIVKVEVIVELTDKALLSICLNHKIPDGIWGGYEILQPADRTVGRTKGKRVAKVVMFRSPSYFVFGNPMGDQTIREYYVPCCYPTVFGTQLDAIRARIQFEQLEKERIENERKAKLLAEQQPLIDEWEDRLIAMSNGLSYDERKTVAIDNLRAMLAFKFVGTHFKVSTSKLYPGINITWEDGPVESEVEKILNLFDIYSVKPDEKTPWMQHFGSFVVQSAHRKMSTLTKAKILNQLSQIAIAFRSAGYHDDVKISAFDLQLLEAMAGVNFHDTSVSHCTYRESDGDYYIRLSDAVLFIFSHTSYLKPKRNTAKKK